ncbi:MAG: hypothetical protein ACRDOK_19755 [Streptosporangiaceae bacterium]
MIHTNAACSPSAVRPDEARRRHTQAAAALRHSPLASVCRCTRAGRVIMTALADVPPLCDRADRLGDRLDQCRRHHQNLEAAARATLAAHADGEADALYYLRDELAAERHGRSDGEVRPW